MAYERFGYSQSIEGEIINAFALLSFAKDKDESPETAIMLLKKALLEGHTSYPLDKPITLESLSTVHIANDRVYDHLEIDKMGANPKDTMPLDFAIKTAFGEQVYSEIENDLLVKQTRQSKWANQAEQNRGWNLFR